VALQLGIAHLAQAFADCGEIEIVAGWCVHHGSTGSSPTAADASIGFSSDTICKVAMMR
jgi:hypothetical protein